MGHFHPQGLQYTSQKAGHLVLFIFVSLLDLDIVTAHVTGIGHVKSHDWFCPQYPM